MTLILEALYAECHYAVDTYKPSLLSVMMLNVTYKPSMLSVVMLNVTYKPYMLSVIMLNVTYKPSMLSDIMLNVVMMSVVTSYVLCSIFCVLCSVFCVLYCVLYMTLACNGCLFQTKYQARVPDILPKGINGTKKVLTYAKNSNYQEI